MYIKSELQKTQAMKKQYLKNYEPKVFPELLRNTNSQT